jgi:HEAT repeat protein
LLEVIRTTKDEDTRRLAAESLGEIDPGNPEVIAGLLEVIRTTNSESTRRQAAESLGKIDPGNPEAIAGLLKIIRTTEHEETCKRAAWSLEKIGMGNPQAISGLLELIHTTEDKKTRLEAAWSLQKILTTPQQYAGVVSALKHNLSNEVYENNFGRFHECYKVIWNCAENLPYPLFYEAWHNPLPTPPSRSHRTNTIGS